MISSISNPNDKIATNNRIATGIIYATGPHLFQIQISLELNSKHEGEVSI